ncbi:hypothetical protein [Segetibacter koreensis]|uniref:hypothetical protein n=1 Tax=Segetibacter koreensis TaxID=398037 RepID=UPI00037D4894|nr:hypothetical protein [Segetibacter koreensis]
MNQAFDIPVFHKGKKLCFKANLLILQYIYQVQVEINGQQIYFEPDEQKNFRAVMNPKMLEAGKKIDVDLLIAIAERLEIIVK